MNSAQQQFLATGGAPTQEDRVLYCLQDNLGNWVGLPLLMQLSGSAVVHSRIAGLRKKGACILNKIERSQDGTRKSFYKLVSL